MAPTDTRTQCSRNPRSFMHTCQIFGVHHAVHLQMPLQFRDHTHKAVVSFDEKGFAENPNETLTSEFVSAVDSLN